MANSTESKRGLGLGSRGKWTHLLSGLPLLDSFEFVFGNAVMNGSTWNARVAISRIALAVAIVFGALTGMPGAFAQATWTSATSGTWGTPGNWSTGIVPGAGNNTAAVLTNTSASYTVTYDTAMTGTLGSLTLTNIASNTTTLNVNAGNVRLSSGTLANASINISAGASVSNTGLLSSTAASKLVISGGSYTGGVNFGNTAEASTITVEMSAGSFALNAANSNNYGRFSMSGGSVTVSGGIFDQVFTSTISGGTYTNSSTNPFNIRGGTFTVTGSGAFNVNRFAINGQGQTLRVDGGAMVVTGDSFRFGDNSFNGGTRSTTGIQNGGSVSMANAAGLVLGQASGTGQSTSSLNLYQFTGGTLSLEKITLAAAGYVSPGINRFEMTGGTLNLGSDGFVIGSGSGTKEILLSGGTVAASAAWSSSANMALRTNTGSGTATVRAADAGNVARNVTLSGVLSGSGALAKTGGGVLELTNANTFLGSTRVAAGRLLLSGSGSINASSGLTLDGGELAQNSTTAMSRTISFGAGGGTISGTGAIASLVAAGTGAILSPGNSPGTQAYTAGLTWNPGGTYVWETNALTGVAGTNWDVIAVSGGALNLSGLSSSSPFVLDLTTLATGNVPGELAGGYTPGTYAFEIATFSSLQVPVSYSNGANSVLTDLFNFNGLANWQGTQPTGLSVKVNSAGNGLELNLVIVPEPAGLIIAGSGLAYAGWRLWKRRRAKPYAGERAHGHDAA